jgi:uncharacterized protein (DUF433 family)
VGKLTSRRSGLIALGEGVYTVAEVSRILHPPLTPRKVHYWLGKGIIGEPVRSGRPGKPTLLSFEQLLMVRTVQHLRDNLNFSLQKITPAIRKLSSFVFEHLFNEEWYQLRFFRTAEHSIGVIDSMDRSIEVDTGQFVMPEALPELEAFLSKTREDWVRREVDIEEFSHLVSNAGVIGGSPTIRGTRIETAFVGYLAQDLSFKELRSLYPYVEEEALLEAMRFEDVDSLAA